ncbi:PadR family transcriptional regulator [Paenibacillus sp. BSR1-1]|uniref:PadR family transcriptional regulator n=1 Tax=Paenibacillus sp. BSR1-1 TaxID=3020845 RepID=UPI0025B122A5|nr:PadR family transcriptional regulator [Paenibacillus sp. BSR1-1]MDN3018347.1 PadR family transcriptional regulator [Paenibacillus sp. BSR1-1]
MENRLRNLKKAMDRKTFSELTFSEEHRKNILEKIKRQDESEETILLAVMQLLAQDRTGFELTMLLRGRGIQKFEENEGFLYTLLHRLEQTGYLQSSWSLETEAKYYQLTDKGRKALRKAEKKQLKKQFVLKELLEW